MSYRPPSETEAIEKQYQEMERYRYGEGPDPKPAAPAPAPTPASSYEALPKSRFNERETIAAGQDFLAMQLGQKPDHAHPLASSISMVDLTLALGLQRRKPGGTTNDRAIMNMGMSTGDFAQMLSEAVKSVTIATYQGQAEHLAFCYPVPCKDFRPSPIPAIDSDIVLEIVGENAEVQRGTAFTAAGSAQVSLTTYAKQIAVSRLLVINDQLSVLQQIFAQAGANAARLESKLVADCLEQNPNLDDGNVVFSTDSGNVIEATPTTGLGAAIAALRLQTTAAGQLSDNKARHLIVSPALEMEARELIFQKNLPFLQVTVMANLPPARWFVTADQALCPTVGVLRLFGTKDPVRVEPRRVPFEFDGQVLQVRADLGCCLLRRTGIIRGGTVS